jgi:hypothetical protein
MYRHDASVTNDPDPPVLNIPASGDAEPVWLGRPSQGDGTCRGGYGLPVVERHGTRCAYCDRDLAASYQDCLDLSVDHVVPRNAKDVGIPIDWIQDLINHVPSCRACNEFLNGYRVTVRVPDDIVGFIELRDAVLAAKRTHAVERRRVEREKFEAWERARRSNPPQP